MEEVRQALAAAPASELVEALARHLADRHGVTEVELMLVDYRLSRLLPLLAGDSRAPAPGAAAWRCFDLQATTADGDGVCVPVTTRGERLGVLYLAPAEKLGGLDPSDLGTALAHELASVQDRTDRYLVGARARRLTLAAEMQWELLPGRSCEAPEFSLAGQLEPAYAVRGDCFDWSLNVGRLSVTVLNGMGEGVTAASLSTLATHAMRNARRAGLPLVEQATLADDAVYAYHRGEQYVSAVMLEIDLRTGRTELVSLGTPVLILVRGGVLADLDVEAHDPLGMFEGQHLAARPVALEPGDRLVIVSDGVDGATVGDRRYGQADLRRLIRRTRALPPLEVVRAVVSELAAFVSGQLDDDAVAVCLDWHGPRGT
jgi:hypothetical protein